MAGVICLNNDQLLCKRTQEYYSPTQDSADQHPAQVTFVVERIQIRGHDIAPIGIDVVVWPFHYGCGSW
jgi:hypothetical protein